MNVSKHLTGFGKTHRLHTWINIEKYIVQTFKVQYLEEAYIGGDL